MFRELLATEPGLPAVSPEEVDGWERHYELLRRWNERAHLVSPASLEKAFALHYVDSLHLAEIADAERGDLAVADLGSGAGFPGLIFALRFPEIPIVLYERNQRKRAFLEIATAALRLRHCRVQAAPASSEKTFWLARAVMPPVELLEFFNDIVRGETRVLVCWGVKSEAVDHPRFRRHATRSYRLPGNSGDRFAAVYESVPRGTSRPSP